ncbi:MAG: AAA family ATPase [Fervidobacterium sp.]
MIELLHINEYVYLKNVDMYFCEGLNVISGETGTGKSLILDIIGAFLNYSSIRSDVFSADMVVNLPSDYTEIGIIRGQHIFSVDKKGRRIFYKMDGKLVTKDIVQSVISNIISIHKQNSHMKLLEKAFILKMLDNVADNGERLNIYKEIYKRYRNILNLISTTDKKKLEEEIEELKGKITEVEVANLSVQEEQELEEEYKRASNVKSLIQNYNDAHQKIDEVNYILRRIYALIEDKYHELLDKSIESLAELGNKISRELLNLDEVDLEDVESRLWIYKKLRRKYGPTTEDVLNNLESWKQELNEKQELLRILNNAEREQKSIEAQLYELAKVISSERKKAANKIIKAVSHHLADLNMNARIDFSFMQKDIAEDGIDDVELVGSTLSTGPLYPLRKIASGGELSRLMLSLELSTISTTVLVYDEIDAGIGGITAVKLAEKLENLAQNHQIIVVTHLPQIALKAHKHFALLRDVDTGIVKELSGKEREEEIKRMFGGEDVVEIIKKTN